MCLWGGVCPEEATTKAGGVESLKLGVAAGRIVHTRVGGQSRYYFPRWEVSRDKVYKQVLSAKVEKEGSQETMERIQEQQWGFGNNQMDPGALLGMVAGTPTPLPSSSQSSCGASDAGPFPMASPTGPVPVAPTGPFHGASSAGPFYGTSSAGSFPGASPTCSSSATGPLLGSTPTIPFLGCECGGASLVWGYFWELNIINAIIIMHFLACYLIPIF